MSKKAYLNAFMKQVNTIDQELGKKSPDKKKIKKSASILSNAFKNENELVKKLKKGKAI